MEDIANTNEAAFALTHTVTIKGEAPSHRQMALQYEKRIQALTEVLRSVMTLASDGLRKSWPWSRHRVLPEILTATDTTRIPEWHEMKA